MASVLFPVKDFLAEVKADAKALHDKAEALMEKAEAEANSASLASDPHMVTLRVIADKLKAAHEACEGLEHAVNEAVMEEQVDG